MPPSRFPLRPRALFATVAAVAWLVPSLVHGQEKPIALVVNDTNLADRSTVDPGDAIAPEITLTDSSVGRIVTNAAGGWAYNIRGNRQGVDETGNYYAYFGSPGFDQPSRVLRTEGLSADGFVQGRLGNFFDYTDAGTFAYSAIDEATNDQGLFSGDNLLLRRGGAVGDSGKFLAGGLFPLRGSASGDITFLAELADTSSATGGARTLLRRTGDGSYTRLLYPGQDGAEIGLPGETVHSSNFALQGTRSFANATGGWLSEVRIGENTATDNTWIHGTAAGAAPLLMNGGGIVREDNLIPAAAGGMAGEAWDTWSFSKTALADTGDWMLTGRTTAAGEMNEVLVRNGQIILREGDALEGTVQGTHLSGTLTGFAGAVAVNEDGDWAAIWDMDLPDLFNRTVILVNGEIVFSTDALVDIDGATFPGTVNQDLLTIIFDDLAISPRRDDGTLDLYFTGRTNGSNAIQYADTILFGMTVPEPTALFALPLTLLALRRRR